MHKETLYESKAPLKAIFIIELIIGALLPSLFYYFFKNDIYIGLFTIAAPLLGLALINSALRDSKIKKISFNETNNCLEIEKQSLMNLSLKEIDLFDLETDLRTGDQPEDFYFIRLSKKIKLIIFEYGKEVETMESGFLSRNNRKIIKLYNALKAIRKTV